MSTFSRVFTFLLAAIVASCASSTQVVGSEPTPEAAAQQPTQPPAVASTLPGPNDVVLVWSSFGGCYDAEVAWCPRTTVRRDGTVTTQLPREYDSDRFNATGTVDTDLIEDWIAVASRTDLASLVAQFGPGPCTAEYDGVDARAAIPWLDITIDECDVEFVEGEPFFDALLMLGNAARSAAPSNVDRYVAENPDPTLVPTPLPEIAPLRTFDELAFHEAVMTWSFVGDCPDAGIGAEGCPRWSVRVDGEVVVFIDHPQLQRYRLSWGTVDSDLVKSLYDTAYATDRLAWLTSLQQPADSDPPITTLATIPLAGISVRSDTTDFDADDPLVNAMRALGDAMAEAAPLADPNGLVDIILGG